MSLDTQSERLTTNAIDNHYDVVLAANGEAPPTNSQQGNQISTADDSQYSNCHMNKSFTAQDETDHSNTRNVLNVINENNSTKTNDPSNDPRTPSRTNKTRTPATTASSATKKERNKKQSQRITQYWNLYQQVADGAHWTNERQVYAHFMASTLSRGESLYEFKTVSGNIPNVGSVKTNRNGIMYKMTLKTTQPLAMPDHQQQPDADKSTTETVPIPQHPGQHVEQPLSGEIFCHTCHLSYYQNKQNEDGKVSVHDQCSRKSLVLQFWSQLFHYHNSIITTPLSQLPLSQRTITLHRAFIRFQKSHFYRNESRQLFLTLSDRISHLRFDSMTTDPTFRRYYAQYIPDMVKNLADKLQSHHRLLLERDKEIVSLRQQSEGYWHCRDVPFPNEETDGNIVETNKTEYEEQPHEQQCLQLEQVIACLNKKNCQLLEEVSELQKEEKEWQDVLEQPSIIDGLVLQIKTLENEIAGFVNELNTQLDNCEYSLKMKDEEIVSLRQHIEDTEYNIAETAYNIEQQGLQCVKLKQEMKFLKEKNALLLGEVSEFRKEEKEWKGVVEQRSILDGLVAQLETLESEISRLKSGVTAHESGNVGTVVPSVEGNVESIIAHESRNVGTVIPSVECNVESIIARESRNVGTVVRSVEGNVESIMGRKHGSESRSKNSNNADIMGMPRGNFGTQQSLAGQNYFDLYQPYQCPTNQNLVGNISTAGSPLFPPPPIVPMMPMVPMFPMFPYMPEYPNVVNATGKPIPVVHHSGDPIYERIVNKRIEFGPLSTVSAPSAVVPFGAKAWYEVRYTRRGFGSSVGGQRIGWCSSKLAQSKEYSKTGVGDGKESYGFDPFHGYKYHDGETIWGKCFETDDMGYVGVALDMIKGEILYSVNGVWNEPLGLAFKGVHIDRKMFPALSGCDAALEVNFGDQAFTYGPPDPSFMKLDML